MNSKQNNRRPAKRPCNSRRKNRMPKFQRSRLDKSAPRQSVFMTRIRQARILCQLSIQRAGELADVSPQAVKDAELGRLAPYPAMRERLSKLYNIREKILFEDLDNWRASLEDFGGDLIKVLPKSWKPPKFDGESHRRFREDDD